MKKKYKAWVTSDNFLILHTGANWRCFTSIEGGRMYPSTTFPPKPANGDRRLSQLYFILKFLKYIPTQVWEHRQ